MGGAKCRANQDSKSESVKKQGKPKWSSCVCPEKEVKW